MSETDILLSSVPISPDGFSRPVKVLSVPVDFGDAWIAEAVKLHGNKGGPLAAVIARLGGDELRPGRVALVGAGNDSLLFAPLLRSSDARRIDAVLFIDGPVSHGAPDAPVVSIEEMAPWAAFGRLAATGARLAVFTSLPINYTGQVREDRVLDWLWRESTGRETPLLDHEAPWGMQASIEPTTFIAGTGVPPVTFTGLPISSYRNKGGLWILAFDSLDHVGTQDMMLQAAVVLPRMLRFFLAPRWNSNAPRDQSCEGARCWPATGLSDAYLAGTADPAPVDIDYGADPTIPSGEGKEPPPVPPEDELVPFVRDPKSALRWIIGIAAALTAAEVLRYGYRKITEKKAVA